MTASRLSRFAIAAALFISPIAGQPDNLLSRAQKLDNEGKCAEAEVLYQEALRTRQSTLNNLPALNNLGNHYLACHQPAKASDIFERLLKLNPAHANANLQMARLAEEQHEPAKALEYLDRVVHPDVEIQIARAQALAETGKRENGVRILHETGRNAKDPRILYALGMACVRTGLYADAEQMFQRVLESDPGDSDVLFNLGAAAARAGHYERARDTFEAVLNTNPADASALYELGRAEASLGDYKRAIYLLAKARQAMPQWAEVDLALAHATEAAGYYGDAIEAYDRYLALRPDDEMARRDRALVAAFTRTRHEEAVKDLQAWAEKHPNDAIGHYDLALAHGQNDRAAALEQASRALTLDARLQPARYYRAWLLEQSGEYEQSLREAKSAVELKPGDARALDLLGLDYLDLSRPAEAEPLLRKAVKLEPPASPDRAEILFHLARCLSELGKAEEARSVRAEFQKARSETPPAAREQAGIVEAATLPPDELAGKVAAEFREAVATNPNDATLRLRLAQALVAAGRPQDAEKALRDLLAMGPSPGIARDAGNLLLADEQYSLAAQFLRRATGEIPAAWLDLAVAEFFASGSGAALQALESAPHEATSTGDYYIVRAMILGAAGQNREAAAELKASMGQRVSHPRLAGEGALLLARLGEPSAALEMTEQAIRSMPADRLLRLSRVAVMAASGRVKEAESAAKEMERRWPEWDRPYVAEALLLEREARFAEAGERIAIAETLGAKDAVAVCARNRASNHAGPAQCGCDAGLWSAISGCGAEKSR
jgi:tetratricopeptide (TPR) repeat protein